MKNLIRTKIYQNICKFDFI